MLETDVYDFNEITNISEVGFRVAFSVRGFGNRELKDDPRYVKYLVRMYGKKEGKDFERILPYHKCEKSDWDKFPPPGSAYSDSFSQIKNGEIDGMYCLDWEDDDAEDKLIYG